MHLPSFLHRPLLPLLTCLLAIATNTAAQVPQPPGMNIFPTQPSVLDGHVVTPVRLHQVIPAVPPSCPAGQQLFSIITRKSTDHGGGNRSSSVVHHTYCAPIISTPPTPPTPPWTPQQHQGNQNQGQWRTARIEDIDFDGSTTTITTQHYLDGEPTHTTTRTFNDTPTNVTGSFHTNRVQDLAQQAEDDYNETVAPQNNNNGGGNCDSCGGGQPYEPGNGGGTNDNGTQNTQDIGFDSCFAGDTPVLMADNTEKPIADIRVGDQVMAFDGHGSLVPARVTKLHVHEATSTIRIGDLVATPNHPFLREDGSFAAIADIPQGAPLYRHDGSTVPKPEQVPAPAMPVYNITVETYHTYIAAGYRVHNK